MHPYLISMQQRVAGLSYSALCLAVLLLVAFLDFRDLASVYWLTGVNDHPPPFAQPLFYTHYATQLSPITLSLPEIYQHYLQGQVIFESPYFESLNPLSGRRSGLAPRDLSFEQGKSMSLALMQRLFHIRIASPVANVIDSSGILTWEFQGDAWTIRDDMGSRLRQIELDVLIDGHALDIPNRNDLTVRLDAVVS